MNTETKSYLSAKTVPDVLSREDVSLFSFSEKETKKEMPNVLPFALTFAAMVLGYLFGAA